MDLIDFYNKINRFGEANNMHFTIISKGHIEYFITIEEKHLATFTNAHGGMIAAFMDGVIGVAALSAIADDGKLANTVEYKITFLKPAKLGEQLKGVGKVDFKGKSILISSGEIFNSQGELIAKATGTFTSYPAEKVIK